MADSTRVAGRKTIKIINYMFYESITRPATINWLLNVAANLIYAGADSGVVYGREKRWIRR